MKKWTKLLLSILTICMFSSLSSVSALAAEGDAYTYKVTLSAGNKGTIAGDSVVTGLKYGDTVSFDLSQVKVTDDKYYVKGVRLSGRDNEEALAAPAFTVDGDADYVVAYGIKGNQVAYTVNYQDADGNSLSESNTFYGNVGDKPVVAYRYIEHYVPEVLALTKTLSDNAAENVFTFVYNPEETDVINETTTITTVVTGRRPGAAGNGVGNGNVAAGNDQADANADDEDVVENPDEDTPKDLVDLDDEETPKSNIDADKDGIKKGLPMVAQIAIVLTAIAALVILILALKSIEDNAIDM